MKILITGASGFIGTNTVAYFTGLGHTVLNLDAQPPLDPAQASFWKKTQILDGEAVRAEMTAFAPDVVLHMAARTDCVEDTTVEAGYAVNTTGTANVLAAIKATPSVQRALITSSQFVCGPGYYPKHDEDYGPATVYGQSKVITEQLTRAAGLTCPWTLIRPTNIWGPWHQRYQREFWRVVARGWYVHPGGAPVVRCYGYVGNIIRQIHGLLEQPAEVVNGQVYYVGDRPADIAQWVDAFSMALRGRRALRVPRAVLAAAGRAGDVISAMTGRPFYITSSRFRSMTSDYVVNMDRTFVLLGPPPISLEEGVRETVAWLRSPAAQKRV